MSKDSGSTSTLPPSETRSAGILEPRVQEAPTPLMARSPFESRT